MPLASNLRRLRVSRGLTQQELAEPSYTHAYISTIEAGRRRPSRAALEHFATKLGVTVDELVTGVSPNLEPRLELELSETRKEMSSGRFGEALEAFERLARRARRHGLRMIEARAVVGAGTCLERRGEPEGAIDRFEGALEVLADDPITTKVDALSGLARCHAMLGDYRYAAYLLEGALHDLRALPDPSALLRIHASLVPTYFDMGLYELAGESAKEALRLATAVEDPFRLATMYLNVAQVHLHNNRVAEAREALERAEQLFSDLGLTSEVAMAHLALGYLFLRDRKLRKARQALERARAQFDTSNDRLNQARVLNELAMLDRLQGRHADAEAKAESVLTLAGDDVRSRAIAHRELGLALLAGDATRAEKNLRAAIELFDRGDQPTEVAATYRLLGDFLADAGRSDEACAGYRRGLLAVEAQV